jgi:hypothetical protein
LRHHRALISSRLVFVCQLEHVNGWLLHEIKRAREKISDNRADSGFAAEIGP